MIKWIKRIWNPQLRRAKRAQDVAAREVRCTNMECEDIIYADGVVNLAYENGDHLRFAKRTYRNRTKKVEVVAETSPHTHAHYGIGEGRTVRVVLGINQ